MMQTDTRGGLAEFGLTKTSRQKLYRFGTDTEPLDAAIVWRGTSYFTNEPIVAIITGLTGDSSNPKTGGMAQLWIIPSNMSPFEAVKTGADRSVCGDCGFRGTQEIIDGIVRHGIGRGCYVLLMGPHSVYCKFA